MFTSGKELDVSQSWNVDLLEDKELKILNSQAGNVLGVMLTADKASLSNVAWTYDANWEKYLPVEISTSEVQEEDRSYRYLIAWKTASNA